MIDYFKEKEFAQYYKQQNGLTFIQQELVFYAASLYKTTRDFYSRDKDGNPSDSPLCVPMRFENISLDFDGVAEYLKERDLGLAVAIKTGQVIRGIDDRQQVQFISYPIRNDFKNETAQYNRVSSESFSKDIISNYDEYLDSIKNNKFYYEILN